MALQNEKTSRYLLRDWKPENPAFWENKGKHIARRNLWISVSCLLLAFCVWMLFSAVTVNLNKIGFNFTTDQLFLLTALPSVSGALLRVPYSFMVPIFGGRRWTVFSTAILIIPCVWLGIAVQNPNTPFGIFIVIALLCGFAGANFASSMGNISFFFPKAKQGSALGINGGLGNLGVSVMQLVAPLVIFIPVFAFLGVNGVPQADGSVMSLANAAWIWVPLLAIATIAAWSGMNDIASSRASIADQLPVLQRLHLWLLSLLYLATFGSFIGFSAGFAMLAKTQFPDVNILRLAFFGPFIGAIARSVGGAISDKFGGVRVTLINFIFMAIFSALLFLTLPGTGSGNFIAFYAVFMGLFLTAGLGSGSTFQMIAVIFRQITIYRVKMKGGSDEQAQRSRHRNGGGSGLYLSHWRSGRLFHSAGVWHVAQYDRLSGRRDESVFNLLHRLCAADLAGLWSAEVQPKIRDRCQTRLIRLQPCRIRQGIRSQFIPGAGVMS